MPYATGSATQPPLPVVVVEVSSPSLRLALLVARLPVPLLAVTCHFMQPLGSASGSGSLMSDATTGTATGTGSGSAFSDSDDSESVMTRSLGHSGYDEGQSLESGAVGTLNLNPVPRPTGGWQYCPVTDECQYRLHC